MKKFNRVFTVLIFIFLYVPMAVLIVASFDTGKSLAGFEGFTMQQYVRLFKDRTLLKLLGNSILLSVLASGIATVFGTVAAVGINGLNPRMRKTVMTLTNIPMTNPDIVTGVSLALLFAFVGTVLKKNHVMGFSTLLIAHITFDMPYVILSVMPKLSQMDPDLQEAALDLGCTPVQSFFKVVIHEILPGIISGCVLVFTMSMTSYVTPKLLGGSKFRMMATMVVQEINVNFDWGAASAISYILLAVILLVQIAVVLCTSGYMKRMGGGK